MPTSASLAISKRNTALLAAIVCCLSNGFFYAFAIFSQDIANVLRVSSSEVIILGILSQVGVGVMQLPTTLALNWFQAHSTKWKDARLDAVMNVFGTCLFCLSMLGIGAVLFVAETTPSSSSSSSSSTVYMVLLGLFFTIWGQAVGASYNTASTIVNYNHQDNTSERRKRIAVVALSVGVGGVAFVFVYNYALSHLPLSTTFFGLAVWFLVVVGTVRFRWMEREMDNNAVVVPLTTTTAPPPSPQQQQPIRALFTNDISLLTFVNVALGLGTSGSMLSSLGLVARSLSSSSAATELTFSLLLTFLVAQVFGRMCNAVGYAYGDWAYVSALWQSMCFLGLAVFLACPNEQGAFASAWFVGSSFGGFHSGFPVLAATVFPGNQKIDYPVSLGMCMLICSLGLIVVGQLTTMVYDEYGLSIYAVFVFLASLQACSAMCAVEVGRRIVLMRRRQQQQQVVTIAHVDDKADDVI